MCVGRWWKWLGGLCGATYLVAAIILCTHRHRRSDTVMDNRRIHNNEIRAFYVLWRFARIVAPIVGETLFFVSAVCGQLSASLVFGKLSLHPKCVLALGANPFGQITSHF